MPADRGGGNGTVPRRTVLGSLVGSTLGLFSTSSDWTATGSTGPTAVLDEVMVHSSCSLLAPGKEPLTDDSVVALRAADSAENIDSEAGGDFEAVPYEDTQIPLVGIDGRVAGIGSAQLVSDGRGGFAYDTEEFVLNLFDELVDGDRVLWDEGHGQEWTLSKYRIFERYAERHGGYTLDATSNLLGSVTVDELRFRSTASQVAPDGGPLTDPDHVLALAPDGANSVDEEDDGAYRYDAEEDIPLAAVDGSVVGLGTPELLTDGGSTAATRQFALNAMEEAVGGVCEDKTVLWDESHGQFHTLSSASTFASAVRETGFEVRATTDLLGGDQGGVETLEWFSTASLLDEDETPLTDPEHVAVWAESTATNTDAKGDGYVPYPDDVDIPLVAVDGLIAGFGAALASDESDVDANRAFLVDAWVDRVGDGGTVLYDEGHDQTRGLDAFSKLADLADSRGLTVESTTAVEQDLDGADAVMITSPVDSFTDAELAALDSFVDDGGAVFLHDQADFETHETVHLNEIAAALDAGFRFNSDQVTDEQHSGFAPFVVRTHNANQDSFPGWFESIGQGESDQVTLDDADVLIVTSPAQAFTDAERVALESFVAEGGSLLLCDQSEYEGRDETANLNAIAETLDLGFRFNPDQVLVDEAFDFTTDRLATDRFPAYFEPGEQSEPGLDEADAVVVTTPSRSFSAAERSALDTFVADGGALVLCNQSDFSGYDETENLNELAAALDLAFRFNSDQVIDGERNAGPEYQPVTSAVTEDYESLFERRATSVGLDLDREQRYEAQVVRVFDGDTVELEFDTEFGYRDNVRLLGIDTPENGETPNDPTEWFGLGDSDTEHLSTWGQKATAFALDRLAPEGAETGETNIDGRSVTLSFDSEEPLKGEYGRLLGYLDYERSAEADGAPETVTYNEEIVETGRARVYSSGFSFHDQYAELETAAYEAGRGVWSAADIDSLPEIRNEPVEELYFPTPRAITSTRGRLSSRRVPVTAAETATREGDDAAGAADSRPPLVAVDERAGVIALGGVPIDETYEADEGFPVDTSEYGNFPFLTNLIDDLSDTGGDVIIEAGHGQFGAPGAISLEDAKFYLRYLEGVDVRCRQLNDLARSLPAEPVPPRAIIITSPAETYTAAERQTLRRYLADGGTVVLAGSAAAPAENTERLNELAAALNTDLRFGDAPIVDETNNLADDPTLVTTSAFDQSAPLFDSYTDRPPAAASYIETIATADGRIDEAARDGAVQDWAAGRIDREQLEAVLAAHERGQSPGGDSP
jgi:endonuclease YncB( thermonuclease family)